jgi:hypothetical protein
MSLGLPEQPIDAVLYGAGLRFDLLVNGFQEEKVLERMVLESVDLIQDGLGVGNQDNRAIVGREGGR